MAEKNLLLCLIALLSIGFSCSSNSMNKEQDEGDIQMKLTQVQQQAFDALNKLQVTIKGQHIYSTFPDLQHDCFPSDTTFTITQAELLSALKDIIAQNSHEDDIRGHNVTASEAVLAQESYIVEQCYADSMQMVNGELTSVQTTTKQSGIWILPNVLDRRDVILKW